MNKLNEIYNLYRGIGGDGGLGGFSGVNGAYSGSQGADGVNGNLNGFLFDNSNSSLTYLNMIYCQSNTDNGHNNQWDNGTIGNYWHYYGGVDIDSDGIGDTPYSIPGSAGSIDYFPIWDDGINFLSVPDDVSFVEYSIGNILSWTVTDNNPTTYQITSDTIVIESGNWISGVPITLNIDELSPGYYVYALTVSDADASTVSDSVIVEVIPISGIFIDDLTSGVGANNWDWAENQGWCSGSGTITDPYVIKNVAVEGRGGKIGLLIENSRAYFEIKSCSISNFEIGIKIVNTTNIKISDSTIENIRALTPIDGKNIIGIVIDNCSKSF